ncbi:MAG: hypothetical protein R3A10_01865 [Caldilineaceae bacterium]
MDAGRGGTEYRFQIELVRKHIPWVSHLTNHMGYLRDTTRCVQRDRGTAGRRIRSGGGPCGPRF